MGAPHLDSEMWDPSSEARTPFHTPKIVIPAGGRKAAAQGSASLPLLQAQTPNHYKAKPQHLLATAPPSVLPFSHFQREESVSQ